MVEKEESPSKPQPPEAAGSAAAAMLATGSASRTHADAYLEKQAKLSDIQAELGREQIVLARLQTEELRREDKLRHWSLRALPAWKNRRGSSRSKISTGRTPSSCRIRAGDNSATA